MPQTLATRRVLFASLLACAALGAGPPPETMQRIFLGHPFDTWTVVGGAAKFALDETDPTRPVLTGNGPIAKNGFLVSPFLLCDFQFEAEVKIGAEMNSGIQIRSRVDDNAVRGLQVEIDPSDRKWSGGIYDEGGKGWLASLKDNPAAQAAFKVGDWNLYRIECEGPSIRTWINGVPCSRWLECNTFSGVLAFQVHSGPKCEVAWRNPRFVPRGAYAWSALPTAAQSTADDLTTVRIPDHCEGIAIDATGAYEVRCVTVLGKEVAAFEADLSPIEGEVAVSSGEVFVVWTRGEGKAQTSTGSMQFTIPTDSSIDALRIRVGKGGALRALRALLPTQPLPYDR